MKPTLDMDSNIPWARVQDFKKGRRGEKQRTVSVILLWSLLQCLGQPQGRSQIFMYDLLGL